VIKKKGVGGQLVDSGIVHSNTHTGIQPTEHKGAKELKNLPHPYIHTEKAKI
jgi:hypothetical protein